VGAATQVQDEAMSSSESLREWPPSSQDSARHEAGLRGTPDRTRQGHIQCQIALVGWLFAFAISDS